jgi:NAD(P)H-hydrate epimerase
VIPVLTAEEMRRADRETIEHAGVPGPVLMENAGAAVARVVGERFPRAEHVVVLCGKGNNGGDGFVVTRHLVPRAEALLLASRSDVAGDVHLQLVSCERSGGRVTEVPDAAAWAAMRTCVDKADLIVDALLGTGLRTRPLGLVAEAIETVRRRAADGIPVVAVDLPSGLPSDSGDVDWPTVCATVTVTFAAPKRGHVLPPACDRVGDLVVADIGISQDALAAVRASLFLLEDADAAAAFPRRPRAAHKGHFGHVLVVAGSVGKTGAAVLAAGASLRAGAGLVTVATPEPCLPMVAAARAEVMTEPLPAGRAGGLALEGLARALSLAAERDAVVLGPGLGQDPATRAFVRAFIRSCPVPLLVDADGLNALAPRDGEPGDLQALRREQPTVLTPHPGEMSRLISRAVPEIQRQRPEAAAGLARETGAVVVLKGERTVVADTTEGRTAVSPTGNPGMATGGTGDVLAGMVGALLARHGAWRAATAAVYLHGKAGDLVARRRGEDGLIAGDLVEAIPEAILAVRSGGGGAPSAR